MPTVSVSFYPEQHHAARYSGSAAVVIDTFRAATTVCAALAAGARRILPTTDLDAARALKRREPGSVLAGERRGVKLPDFDLGNSPREFNRENVGGKVVVFTTTHGTRALLSAREADLVVMGCLANRRAVVDRIAGIRLPLHLICSGTDGEPAVEDLVAAGAIVEDLLTRFGGKWSADDPATACRMMFQQCRDRLGPALSQSTGARHVSAAGLADDLPVCTALDSMSVVPEVVEKVILLSRTWSVIGPGPAPGSEIGIE